MKVATPSTATPRAMLLHKPFERSPIRTESTSALGITTAQESQLRGL